AALRVPGPADLDPAGSRDDVVVARAADDRPAFQIAHRPGQEFALALAFERVVDVLPGFVRLGNRGEEQLPEAAVLRGFPQPRFMLRRERLEAHAVPFERLRNRPDHAAPRSKPSLRNMSRMPRAAWRRRCSFSMSAILTWSSP